MNSVPSDQSFGYNRRFHNTRDFNRLFRRQQIARNRYCTVLLAPRPQGARLGVVVSTRVSKRAVQRHRCKRWARELWRRELLERLHEWDCVVVFQRVPESFAKFRKSLHKLIPLAVQAEPKPRKLQPRRRK